MSNQAEIYQSQVIHFSQKHWKTLHTKKNTPLEREEAQSKCRISETKSHESVAVLCKPLNY